MVSINNKTVRGFSALVLAFGSLFWAAPATASDLDQARADLVIAQQEVEDSQTALNDASAAVATASAEVERISADVQASAQGGMITETFGDTGQRTLDGPRYLVGQSTEVNATANHGYSYTTNLVNGTYASGGMIKAQWPSDSLYIKTRNTTTTYFSMATAAVNGSFAAEIRYTDGSTGSMAIPNGVSPETEADGYTMVVSHTAPSGKFIEGILIPMFDDYYALDNFIFVSEVYDADLVSLLNDARAIYDQALANETVAQARYDLAILEVIRLEQLIVDLTPYLNAPGNLVVTLTDAGVDLVWDAPTPHTSGVSVERYAIFWSTTNFTENGWAWSHDQTNVSIPLDVLNSAGGLGNNFQFKIRADNDSQSIYSGWSNTVDLQVDAPAIEQWWDVQWDENSTITLTANTGYVFDSATAWYGTPSNTCGLDVSDIITNLIAGKDSVSFVANNDLLSDPCPGWGKVLRFSATLSQVSSPETESPTAEEEVQEPILPQPTPEPETTPQPLPTTPSPEPTPIPEPTLDPTPIIPETPTPTQPEDLPDVEIPDIIEETPVEEPVDEQPVTEPEPEQEPDIPFEEEPTPEPSPSEEPAEEPEEAKPTPIREPESPETTEPREPELSLEDSIEAISELDSINPDEITDEQAEQIYEAALVVFDTAVPGSEEYELALEALMVVAEADDLELSEELAAIPLIGDVAGAVLEVFNDLGNIGADMSPEVREDSEKVVVAAVIVGQIAITATTTASMSAAMAARRP